jgi:hypothetical protein
VTQGHLYFNDDDTIIHENLWEHIQNLETHYLITFMQLDTDLKTIRLGGDQVGVRFTDSHNFIVSYGIGKNFHWSKPSYDADGIYAYHCSMISKNPIYIPVVLSIYNCLKTDLFKDK